MNLHIETRDRAEEGTWLEAGDKIGHPSCEGGVATGTHTHVARKFNGEWILAAGPLPFAMSGYVATGGEVAYQGLLVNGNEIVSANGLGSYASNIRRR